MADFLRATNDDWDLEAIIRGWGGGGSGGGCTMVQMPPPSPTPLLGFDFDESEFVTSGTGFNELEEMCKPFVVQVEQKTQNESSQSGQTETTSPCSSPFGLFDHEEGVDKPKEVEMETGMKEHAYHLDVQDYAQARSSCKRRKSKHKIVRVVHRGVEEDGVLMDKWNWRKYGQKAIKGSPYPRSYYRCSSSGGCHARKHVEQSKDSCHTFVVTYIADHSHLPPTRRHAQAGRKITKFSASAANAAVINAHTESIPAPESMTWMIPDPSISDDGYRPSNGLGVMEELFKTGGFDHDEFNNWELDPIFSTYIC